MALSHAISAYATRFDGPLFQSCRTLLKDLIAEAIANSFSFCTSAEVQAQLYVGLYVGYLNQNQFQELYNLAGDTSRLIGGFIRYLKRVESKAQTQ